MGIYRLETYLENGVPNDYCRRISIQELGRQYKQDTGKTPVIIVDGAYSLRTIYSDIRREWFLGGQLKEFIEAMKKFVRAFTDIGVEVMFFFDGASREEKRDTWRERRLQQLKDVETLFNQLRDRNCPNVGELTQSVNGRVFLLPPLIGAVGRFIAKYVLHCQVRVSSSECDAEIAEYSWQHGIFGILSRDTDFVLLRGARHYFSIERLDMNDMTTFTYSKEGLKKSLSLEEHELLMLATLLGNDIVPFCKVHKFHQRLCPTKSKNIFILLPVIAQYIKERKIPNDCNFECLQDMAKEIFSAENMAEDLKKSIQSYLPLQGEEQIENGQIKYEDENWQKILTLLQQKHLSCCLTPHLYPVTLGEAYELGVAIEDFEKHDRKPVASIYLPLRKRIYGILLKEKKGISCVKEWCIEQYNCPREPYSAPLHFIDNIENLHPGLLKLWSDNCSDTIRWKLFAESLTQNTKIDFKRLQNLGFPYAVPVAVLYYLSQEQKLQKEKLLAEIETTAILAHAALVAEYDADKLRHIHSYRMYNIQAIVLATVFHRGITTVLYLLEACGFDLEQAMPWHYFDGRLLHKKYVDARKGMRDFQLCEDKEATYRLYLKMKNLVTPPQSWR